MSSSILLCFIFSLFLSVTAAGTPAKPFHPRAVVLPVTKDPSTGQYLTTIFQRTPLKPVKLTVDIGGKALWVACDRREYASTTYAPALCGSPPCAVAKSKSCDNCFDGPRPGCNNNTVGTRMG